MKARQDQGIKAQHHSPGCSALSTEPAFCALHFLPTPSGPTSRTCGSVSYAIPLEHGGTHNSLHMKPQEALRNASKFFLRIP